MSLGPEVRLLYMTKYIPVVKEALALLVGVVNNNECELICSKGYNVTKADINPRDNSILQLDLANPGKDMLNSINLLIASDVLEHIEDDRAAVKGVYDLLLPGGMAYIHVPGGDINAPLNDLDLEHGHVRHGYSEAQIKDVIHTQPFHTIEYIKTFNKVETEACMLYQKGDRNGAKAKLSTSTFDGREGRSHLFLLLK
jgi:SAM-dependent methyltransferase